MNEYMPASLHDEGIRVADHMVVHIGYGLGTESYERVPVYTALAPEATCRVLGKMVEASMYPDEPAQR